MLSLIVGIAFVAYPYVSDYLNRVEQARLAALQEEAVHEAPAEDLSAEAARAREFNEHLLQGRVVVTDPFDPDNVAPSDEEYERALNLAGDGVMGTITIPKIDVNLPVYHGVEGDGMNHAVGHMPSTSLPIGGPSTHAVLAGHTGLPGAIIFDNLDQLVVGDWFVVTVLGEDHAYEVTNIEIVLPGETESLHVVEGEDIVTLVTCTPYGINSHRLLIHARRCEVPAEWLAMRSGGGPAIVSPTVARSPLFIFSMFGAAIGLGALPAWLFLSVRDKRRGLGLELGAEGDGVIERGKPDGQEASEPDERAARSASMSEPRPDWRSAIPAIGENTSEEGAGQPTHAPKHFRQQASSVTAMGVGATAPDVSGQPFSPDEEGGEKPIRRGRHFK